MNLLVIFLKDIYSQNNGICYSFPSKHVQIFSDIFVLFQVTTKSSDNPGNTFQYRYMSMTLIHP